MSEEKKVVKRHQNNQQHSCLQLKSAPFLILGGMMVKNPRSNKFKVNKLNITSEIVLPHCVKCEGWGKKKKVDKRHQIDQQHSCSILGVILDLSTYAKIECHSWPFPLQLQKKFQSNWLCEWRKKRWSKDIRKISNILASFCILITSSHSSPYPKGKIIGCCKHQFKRVQEIQLEKLF